MNVYTNDGITTYIAITAGETVALAMTITGSGGSAVNLTGYSLKCQINCPGTPLLLNTTGGGITITNATAGQVQLNVSNTQSAALPAGTYPFDMWMVSSGSVETPLLSGFFAVAPNVSPVP